MALPWFTFFFLPQISPNNRPPWSGPTWTVIKTTNKGHPLIDLCGRAGWHHLIIKSWDTDTNHCPFEGIFIPTSMLHFRSYSRANHYLNCTEILAGTLYHFPITVVNAPISMGEGASGGLPIPVGNRFRNFISSRSALLSVCAKLCCYAERLE